MTVFDISKGKRQLALEQGPAKRLVSENMDHEAILFEYYKRNGKNKIHFCPSWDYMAIHSLSPEFQACACDKAKLT